MKIKIINLIIIALLIKNILNAQTLYPENMPEFNIVQSNDPEDGYLFLVLRPLVIKEPAYLLIMDKYGVPVFYRYMTQESGNLVIQPNNLLSYRGQDSIQYKFFIMDSSYNTIDSIEMKDYILDNHDFIALENGNFLIFGADIRTIDMSQIVDGGKTNASVLGCVIQELDPDKNIVFEWNSWDHFQITDTYKDLTKSSIDVVHPNALEIDLDGNILLVGRELNEVTKINRQTGEVIWRWGGKNNQFTFSDSSDMFLFPHDIRVLPNGNYTLFDNGKNRDPLYTRAVEYKLDTNIMTAELVWEFDANKEVYAKSGGSHMRLSNGNSLIGYGGQVSKPSVIEVNSDGSIAYQIDFVGDFCAPSAFKAPWETNLFETSVDKIDFGTYEYIPIPYILKIKNNSNKALNITSVFTMTDYFSISNQFPIQISAFKDTTITVWFNADFTNTGFFEDILTINSDINSDTLVQRIARQVRLTGCAEDFNSPEAIIDLEGMKNMPLDTFITVIFNEKIRCLDNSELNYLNIDSYIFLRPDSETGDEIEFDAVINTEKTKIFIQPKSNLISDHKYYVIINDSLEDYSDNRFGGIKGFFNTLDFTSPIAKIIPDNNSTNVDVLAQIQIIFNEPVRNIDDTELSEEKIAELIDFRILENEENITFSIRINNNKDTIIVIPDNQLNELTTYYFSLNGNLEDYYDNKIDTIISVFSTATIENINTQFQNTNIQVFPNPSNGEVKIEFAEIYERILKIYNINGVLLEELMIGQRAMIIIDLNKFFDNIFILEIKNLEKKSSIYKVIVKK